MTDFELRKFKADLWHAADVLRAGAHLAANKYGQPILGLIFLRYADLLYKQHKEEIEKEYESLKGTRREKSIKEIAIEKCNFYLPECAYFDYINNAPDTAEKANLVKQAMEAIEEHNPAMTGVLPKEVYGQLVPEEEPELLSRIIRTFKDIPENINIDLFGEIYEYFLGNFALSEGKDGGTFYTPASVVRYMVEVLQPMAGEEKKILDPACGSGGMFVQAARYMHRHNASNDDLMQFRCYGVEKEPDTVKLAKMNLFLNHVRGEITEANSFYADPYNAVGNFDYVMANPPFNVDEVVYEKVKDDERFNQYGIPKNKTKSSKKNSDKKETVPNANYLWINYFATSLNDTGKAALVMANSASDAGKSELEIRKKLIESGIIKQMVTLPSNMFTSVTLPATLWFFDKEKASTEKKDEILFIDARNVFTQVDRAHRKFSDEQIKNLAIITRLYEGKTEEFKALINEYKNNALQEISVLSTIFSDFKRVEYTIGELTEQFNSNGIEVKSDLLVDFSAASLHELKEQILRQKESVNQQIKQFSKKVKNIHSSIDNVDLEPSIVLLNYNSQADEALYWIDNLLWLTEKFPNGIYQDVIGLCKVAKLEGEDGIIDQDYSLNAGRYVGVVIEDDGMTEEEFKETMLNLNTELSALNAQAQELEQQIAENIKNIFGE